MPNWLPVSWSKSSWRVTASTIKPSKNLVSSSSSIWPITPSIHNLMSPLMNLFSKQYHPLSASVTTSPFKSKKKSSSSVTKIASHEESKSSNLTQNCFKFCSPMTPSPTTKIKLEPKSLQAWKPNSLSDFHRKLKSTTNMNWLLLLKDKNSLCQFTQSENEPWLIFLTSSILAHVQSSSVHKSLLS